MQRYSVVIFKNRKKKKIIKKFVSLKTASDFFEKIYNENSKTLFETKFENGKECKFDLVLIDNNPDEFTQIYHTDEFGRNYKVKLDDKKQTILKISDYLVEELVFDLQKKEKISLEKILTTYLRNQNLKMIFLLNNKIVIQDDDKFSLFSLKNSYESKRFIDCLSNYFFINRRTDCLFITDDSKPQKKYLYKLLEEKGWEKKVLYRGFTTFRAR